ncbi:uncharacterized protein HMPREF1541_03798 [Cyphellophora europaea CBS 101466]|uniref:P-loop containing nucleoside triphosphate hydrolase protein n=1 Tax=Cyphellophora europaea (strain CBS 101466) TaxID=1220924 RepID=W2S1N2_CYPE1|nr:uncharacterized protein HMPREF1541_03798 [Cyphellophora europaea CBS 101466]ETN41859.1 hypothetical protein HMPREF1541_03798 [Cyphellophora europaea CBS 101466]
MAPKRGQGKKVAASKTPAVPQEADYVVFTNSKGPDVPNRKKKAEDKDATPAPPRPDTKKLIGGASWTGKLPVNLLSEQCQREKWNKPEYSMRTVNNDGEKAFRSSVTLSKRDPKTQEVTTLPSFELPRSHQDQANEPTALEARHFAATYTLHRIASMKQIHMALPPKYRDLWKGLFADLKKEDVAENRGWKYDADPFAADAKRKEIHAAMDKRKEDQEKRDAKKAAEKEAGIVPIPRNSAFARAPRIELGENLRNELEGVVRANTHWNVNHIHLSRSDQQQAEAELTASGFRAAHVREALEYVGSREEAFEWLLIHVPEDDLPPWTLPSTYSAGVSLASTNPTKDAKIRRLARAGYSGNLCSQALRDNDDNELEALEALQSSLVPPGISEATEAFLDIDVWEEEMTALEAIQGENFVLHGPGACSIKIQQPQPSSTTIHFYKPQSGYPDRSVPIIAIDAPIPAHVRLSALRQCLNYAWNTLIGDQMLYALIEWLEANLSNVLANPGKLIDIDVEATDLGLKQVAENAKSEAKSKISPPQRLPTRTSAKDRRNDAEIKQAWEARQRTDAQQQMLKSRQALPAWNRRAEVVDAIKSKQVTLITGETGSGKSTQSLQFVLDDAIQNGTGSTCSMICTQPRRVAALSLSDRVSAERCVSEGDEVGHIIRGASKTSSRTKITFMTTGVLLRRLQMSKSTKAALEGISHVFVDEVHERSLDTDFLLALLKDAMKTSKLKVVLMSATVDADIFASYFGGDSMVARAHIEGRTYPVQDLYLDDVLRMTGYVGQQLQEEDRDRELGKAIQSLGAGVNYDLIAALVTQIDGDLGTKPGGILIFLPGTLEIDRCLRAVTQVPRMHALPLHASLLPAEQKRVFPPAPKGTRKVICATNVAETSITIPDIVAVIDTGRVKETAYDIVSNIVRLQEVWASKAQCKQRRGRAGRVQAGTNYKLYTRNVEASMRAASEPEIQRVPLEQLCLNVKATAPAVDVSAFLRNVISPPSSTAVTNAVSLLHRMGALESNLLTGLGTYMSMLPTDLRLAKLVIYGALFSCLEAALTIAAILTVKSPFVSPRDKRDEAKAARLAFPSADGDLLLDLAAFSEWKTNLSRLPNREVAQWCNAHFLSQQTLRDIDSTRSLLLDALKEAALLPPNYYSRDTAPTYGQFNAHLDNRPLLRALIAGALSPNIAEIKFPEKKFMASISGAKELDPEARTIKFFTEPPSSLSSSSTSGDAYPDNSAAGKPPTSNINTTNNNERVFLHPSTALFTAQSFPNHSAYVSFFTRMATSKTFVREVTPVNAYGLLLFGGRVEVDGSGAGVSVDGWVRMRGWARIGVLVARLRGVLDAELRRRVEGEGGESGEGGWGAGAGGKEWERVQRVVRRLVELNGQDV